MHLPIAPLRRLLMCAALISMLPAVAHAQAAPLFRVLPTGNVGIGVDNPQKKLDVSGDIKLTGCIYFPGGTYCGPGDSAANADSAALAGQLKALQEEVKALRQQVRDLQTKKN